MQDTDTLDTLTFHSKIFTVATPSYMHGAKRVRTTCRFEGCTNQAQQGGVCYRHGADPGWRHRSYKYKKRRSCKKRKRSAEVNLVSDGSDSDQDSNDRVNSQQRRTRRRIQSPPESSSSLNDQTQAIIEQQRNGERSKVCYDVEIAPRVNGRTYQSVGNRITNSNSMGGVNVEEGTQSIDEAGDNQGDRHDIVFDQDVVDSSKQQLEV